MEARVSAYRLAEFIEQHECTAVVDERDHNFLLVASIAFHKGKKIGVIQRIPAQLKPVRDWLGY
jgi:hypothetical protein